MPTHSNQVAQGQSSCLLAAQGGDKQQTGQGQRSYTDCRFLNAEPMPSWCKYCQPQLSNQLFVTLSSGNLICEQNRLNPADCPKAIASRANKHPSLLLVKLLLCSQRKAQPTLQQKCLIFCLHFPSVFHIIPAPSSTSAFTNPPQQHHHLLSWSPISHPVVKLLSLEL